MLTDYGSNERVRLARRGPIPDRDAANVVFLDEIENRFLRALQILLWLGRIDGLVL